MGLVILGNSTLSSPNAEIILSGTLQINLEDRPDIPVVFTVVYGYFVTGQFDMIDVSIPNLQSCEKVSSSPSYGGNLVSVTIYVDQSGCNVPIPPGTYIGIAIGVILVGVLVGVSIGIYRKYKMNLFTVAAKEQILLRHMDDIEYQKEQAVADFNRDSSSTSIN